MKTMQGNDDDTTGSSVGSGGGGGCDGVSVRESSKNDVDDEESQEWRDASSTSSTTPPPSIVNVSELMESAVRVTLAGLGGSIIGLSLEKRLESMRVTTAAGLTAAARRKRSPSVNLVVNLPLTWGLSCMVFCSVVETCRLTSPATWLFQFGDEMSGGLFNRQWPNGNQDDVGTVSTTTKVLKPPAITVTDYAIGGAVAGIAGSFGRRMNFRNSIARMNGSRKFFGLLPGIGLGVVAGCVQVATDYGTAMAERASTNNQKTDQERKIE